MIRRRALLAASAASGGGDQGWVYELQLTPEWDFEIFKVAHIYGDFSSLLSTLISIMGNFGTTDEWTSYTSEFPEEFIFTVDGVSISYASYSIEDSSSVTVQFGDYISGFVEADRIYLENIEL